MKPKIKHPAFSFRLQYAGEWLHCCAVMFDDYHQVLFNQKPVAELQMDDDMEWILAAGTILPDDIVYHIGRRIESYYK